MKSQSPTRTHAACGQLSTSGAQSRCCRRTCTSMWSRCPLVRERLHVASKFGIEMKLPFLYSHPLECFDEIMRARYRRRAPRDSQTPLAPPLRLSPSLPLRVSRHGGWSYSGAGHLWPQVHKQATIDRPVTDGRKGGRGAEGSRWQALAVRSPLRGEPRALPVIQVSTDQEGCVTASYVWP